MSDLSWLNPTPHAIAVYASQPPSPVATQHSLPSRTLPFTWAGLSPAGSHQLCLAHVAVGTCVSLHVPPPEPYVRLSCTLLPHRHTTPVHCTHRTLLAPVPLFPHPSLHRLRCARP